MKQAQKNDPAKVNRVPPCDIDAERAVLGAMINEDTTNEAIGKTISILGNGNGASIFYKESHQKIYNAILNLYDTKEPIDLYTTTRELMRIGELEKVGDVYYLDELIDSVPVAINIEIYAVAVKEEALRRAVISQISGIYESAFDDSIDIEILFDKACDFLAEIKASYPEGNKSRKIERASDFIAREKEKTPYIIGKGIIPSQGYSILAGYTGIGKSTLGLQMAMCILKNEPFLNTFPIEKKDTHILYLNLENSEFTISQLLASQLKEYNPTKAQLDHLIIPDSIGMTLENQKDISMLERWVEEYHLELVIIDPILLALDSDQNDYTPVRKFIRRLQNIEKPVAWLFMHHFKKPGVEKTNDLIHSILGSSGWSNSATTIMALTRYAETRNPFYKKITFEKVRDFEKPEPITITMNPETRCYEVIAESGDIPGCNNQDVIDAINSKGGSIQYTNLITILEMKLGIARGTAKSLVSRTLSTHKIKADNGIYSVNNQVFKSYTEMYDK